jgi:predicted RecA/RadA family phage recombinase
MKNFIQDGNALDLAAPYARSSGEAAKIGSIFGVAIKTVSSAEVATFYTEGVYELVKDTTDITEGLKVYWDDSAKKITATSTANLPVGLAVAAAGTGATLVKVKIGSVPPAAGA